MWDIQWTHDFDFNLVQDMYNKTDLMKCDNQAAFEQVITNRLISVHPDWFYDYKGADLELLVGEPNTRDTAEQGVAQIRNVLCGDGFISNEDLYIKPIPVDLDNIIFFCFIKNPYYTGKLTFQTEICLSGETNVRLIKD